MRNYGIFQGIIVVFIFVLCNVFYHIMECYLSLTKVGMVDRIILKSYVSFYVDCFIFMFFH